MQQDYKLNREDFLKTAKARGARLYTLAHPLSAEGAELITDIAVLGEDTAKNCVVVTSGLHGVELPAGSRFQQIGLKSVTDAHLENTKFVFIHALNPYGAHHAMRTDCGEDGERNIDPARNFVDFASPDFKRLEADKAIASAFDKADLSASSQTMMWARLLYAAFVEQGQDSFKRNFVQGQYTNPILPYYGGNAPSFTRLTWEKLVREEIINASLKNIYHLDIHTGDGPFAQLQIYLCNDAGPHTKELALSLMALEHVKTTDDYFAEVIGDIGDYWYRFDLPDGVKIYPLTLEFGTTQSRIAGIDVLGAILNRTLLSEKYADKHPTKDDIIRKMRTAFTPTQDDWAAAITDQSKDIWKNILLTTK